MKKYVALILVLMLAMFGMAGCGGSGSSDSSGGSDSGEAVNVDSLTTIGDVIAMEPEGLQSAVFENHVVYAFQAGDTYYRVIADISDEDQEKYFNISYEDQDYEAQQNEIVSPLAIAKIENLNEQMLSQEDMDALVGKTGKELQDEGWTFSGHDLEKMEFWMNYGPFLYTVTMDGTVEEKDWETFNDETDTKDMKVKSVEFNSLGEATNIEFENEE